MSHKDIEQFKNQVELKNVRAVTSGPLILFNYTNQCTYDRAWDTEYTRNARGVIYDVFTGNLVAKPFPKFFNLGEMQETMLSNLPNEPYKVFEKVDGSLGIIYHFNDKKTIGLLTQTEGRFKHSGAIFPFILNKKEALNNYIMKYIRPTGNHLVAA